jgi:hypothetical protein
MRHRFAGEPDGTLVASVRCRERFLRQWKRLCCSSIEWWIEVLITCKCYQLDRVAVEHRMKDATEHMEAAVRSHPLCEQIVHFLIEHERAMDTIHGVAKCWVDGDELAVKSALDRLLAVGVLASQSLSSGTYYSLTPDANVRAWLRANRSTLPRERGTPIDDGNNGVGVAVGGAA